MIPASAGRTLASVGGAADRTSPRILFSPTKSMTSSAKIGALRLAARFQAALVSMRDNLAAEVCYGTGGTITVERLVFLLTRRSGRST